MQLSCWKSSLCSHKHSFSDNSRRSPDIDTPIGLNPCGDHRRPSHGFALDEGALRFSAKTAALLKVIGQRGIGGSCRRLLGDVARRRKVVDMGGVVIVIESENMKADGLVLFRDF